MARQSGFVLLREESWAVQVAALLGPKTEADMAKPDKKKKEPKVGLNPSRCSCARDCRVCPAC